MQVCWRGSAVESSYLQAERDPVLAGWLIPGMVFFSVAGFFHQYYLIMLAPPIAALAGAGAVDSGTNTAPGTAWQCGCCRAAVLATTALQFIYCTLTSGRSARPGPSASGSRALRRRWR